MLHAGRNLGIDEVQRHFHVDFLVLGHTLKVNVLDLLAERMHDEIAQQHLFFFTVQIERKHRGVKGFLAQAVV